MFGFGKKESQVDVATNTVLGLLALQLTLARSNESRLTDGFSMGYIFGACDAILRSSGNNDERDLMKVLTAVHMDIYGLGESASTLKKSLNMQRDKEHYDGAVKGGRELLQFFKDKTPPMGLANYLMGK